MRVDDFIIAETATILDAMKQLDVTGQRILFIAPEGLLKAVLTDGDLRKLILSGGDLHRPIKEAANYAPISLPLAERYRARGELARLSIDAIPLIDRDGQIADVVFANDFDIDTRKKIRLPVVIQAGGFGTRLYPYTKILPKPLIPVGEEPIVEEIIHQFCDAGCCKFYMIVNHKKNMIKSYFADSEKSYDITFVDEDIPLGTGGGLSLLKGQIDETFFMTNCDILIDADFSNIYKEHKKSGNLITMVCALKNFVLPYGVVELSEDGCVAAMKEKPELSFLTNTGLYVMEPQVIHDIKEGENIPVTDLFERYRTAGQKVGVYPVRENSWMDMGQLEELEDMRRRLEERRG